MSAEHSDRRNHHRQPRRVALYHWGTSTDYFRHDGDVDDCPICHPKETSDEA